MTGAEITDLTKYKIYQVYVSSHESLNFADTDDLPQVMARWVRARQNLDQLEDDYETRMENYNKELDRLAQADIPDTEQPARPNKVMLTDELLVKFSGNDQGLLGGSVFVGVVFGIKKIG